MMISRPSVEIEQTRDFVTIGGLGLARLRVELAIDQFGLRLAIHDVAQEHERVVAGLRLGGLSPGSPG